MIPTLFASRYLGGRAAAAGGGATDPNFANVVALLHMDGADASTTFTDVKGNTWTTNGSPTISMAQSKFGGSSLLLDANGEWLRCNTAAFNLGTGDFTIEDWIYLTTVNKLNVINAQTANGFSLSVTNGNKLQFAQAFVAARLTGSINIVANTWTHVAATRASGTLRLFVNGTQDGSVANTNDLNASDTGIGGYTGVVSTDTLRGHIDDCRLTKGVARYTASFTPPTSAFPDS